jgi:hypothetical protein
MLWLSILWIKEKVRRNEKTGGLNYHFLLQLLKNSSINFTFLFLALLVVKIKP